MTQYVLLTYDDNYADEFNIHGLRVITKEQYEKSLKELDLYFEKYESYYWYFGTNEAMEYHCAESLLGAYDVVDLTEEQYLFYKQENLLNFGHTGPLPFIDSSSERDYY